MRTKTMTNFKSLVLFLAVALTICMTRMQVKADVLASPKDAKQTAADEKGVKVSWSAVAGAKSYVYSFSSDGKNYTAEAPTGNGGVDTFVAILNDTLTAGTDYYVKVRAYDGASYSEPVVVKTATAPKIPTYIKQIEAESTSVTVTWDKSAGATGYLIRFGTSEATAKDYAVVKNTTCKLTGLTADTQYYIAVFPVRKVTNDFNASYDSIKCYRLVTTAGPVSKLALAEWNVKTSQIEISWENTAKYESGYQFEIYSADGAKLLKTYNVTGRRVKRTYFKNKKLQNTPFQFRIRAYTNIAGQKFYGAWSDMAYAVPQGNVSATKKSDTSIQLTWDKIAGAQNYTVYMGTTDGGKFKAVDTVKKPKYVVTNLTTDKDYFFYVKANKITMGGKKKNSNKVETTNDIYVYISKYLDTVVQD